MAAGETTSSEYVRWEEVHVSSDQRKKRRGEVRYYLRRRDGKSDLAVIGKQKKKGHFSNSNHHHVSSSYHYAIQDRFLRSSISISPYSSSYSLKLRSRREVVDWLNSFVSGTHTYTISCFPFLGINFSMYVWFECFSSDKKGHFPFTFTFAVFVLSVIYLI